MGTGDHTAAGSGRLSKSEAEMATKVAVLESELEHVQSDVKLLQKQVSHLQTKYITASGPHPILVNGRRDAAIGGSAAAGGVLITLLIEWLTRTFGG